MAQQKSMASFDEEIEKVSGHIEDLQVRLRKKRADLKELEEGKRALQGTILLQKFWDKGIDDFDQVENLLDQLVEKAEPKNEIDSNAEESHDQSKGGRDE